MTVGDGNGQPTSASVERVSARSSIGPPSCLRLGIEDVLDLLVEDTGDLERQRKAGVVLADLDGIHGLPRDPELTGKTSLGQLVLGSKQSQPVPHE